MKRRNPECGKLRRPLKRNKIAEGLYGSTFVYVRFIMVWAMVLLADFILEFRFEFLWPFWLLLRSVYDSFKFQGLAFSVFFVCIALTSDMVCFLLLPVQWLFFAASTYVWVQYVWHTERGVCLPTVSLWLLFIYIEATFRLKDLKHFHIDLCRPFAAHCIGYPVVTLGFGFKSYLAYRLRVRRQRDVRKENEFYQQLLQQALPPGQQRRGDGTEETDVKSYPDDGGVGGQGVAISPASSLSPASLSQHQANGGSVPGQISSSPSPVPRRSPPAHSELGARKLTADFASRSLEHEYTDVRSGVDGQNAGTSLVGDNSARENSSVIPASVSGGFGGSATGQRGFRNQNGGPCTPPKPAQNNGGTGSTFGTGSGFGGVRGKGKIGGSGAKAGTGGASIPVSVGNGGQKDADGMACSAGSGGGGGSKDLNRLELEVRRLKADLIASRGTEQEARGQLAQMVAKETQLKAELTSARRELDGLTSRLTSLTQAKQREKQNCQALERRLRAETEARAGLERQLAEERRRRKQQEEAARATATVERGEGADTLRSRVRELEVSERQLQRELESRDEQIDALERDNQELPRLREAEKELEVLLVTLAAMREKHHQLESSLSAETRIKLDLFSALGDAKRQLEIVQGQLILKEQEIEELKQRIAEVMAVMPSTVYGSPPAPPVTLAPHYSANFMEKPGGVGGSSGGPGGPGGPVCGCLQPPASPLDPNASVYQPLKK
uniref:macoilin isoform X2 n=1 Tax=Myxine glutinosa TaxID=7769 RepID=UPI00358E601D